MKLAIQLWERFCALRFVIVGVWNTIFAYLVFSGLYRLIGGGWGDLVVQFFACIINITQTFVMHRFVTYRSEGVWWREYLRFYVVYGLQGVLQAAFFFVFSTWLGYNGYITQLVLTALFTIVSYWGHKVYSFRQPKEI